MRGAGADPRQQGLASRARMRFAKGGSRRGGGPPYRSLRARRTHVKRFAALALLAGLTLSPAFARAQDDTKTPVVVMETNYGTIKIELDPAKAPGTVKNFLQYVDDKFYDGTVFHRVISNFMVQGGGFQPGMKEKKTKEAIKNESENGVSNTKYTVAMARTNQPDSATAQFFVNVKDNNSQDHTTALH